MAPVRVYPVVTGDVLIPAITGEMVRRLREGAEPLGVNIAYSDISPKLHPPIMGCETSAASATAPCDNEDGVILYVGGESLALTNLLMTHASWEASRYLNHPLSIPSPNLPMLIFSSQVYSYNPGSRTTRLESGRTNKLLMRRYAAMQKARDADVFGILVGTLGIGEPSPSFCRIGVDSSITRLFFFLIAETSSLPAFDRVYP